MTQRLYIFPAIVVVLTLIVLNACNDRQSELLIENSYPTASTENRRQNNRDIKNDSLQKPQALTIENNAWIESNFHPRARANEDRFGDANHQVVTAEIISDPEQASGQLFLETWKAIATVTHLLIAEKNRIWFQKKYLQTQTFVTFIHWIARTLNLQVDDIAGAVNRFTFESFKIIDEQQRPLAISTVKGQHYQLRQFDYSLKSEQVFGVSAIHDHGLSLFGISFYHSDDDANRVGGTVADVFFENSGGNSPLTCRVVFDNHNEANVNCTALLTLFSYLIYKTDTSYFANITIDAIDPIAIGAWQAEPVDTSAPQTEAENVSFFLKMTRFLIDQGSQINLRHGFFRQAKEDHFLKPYYDDFIKRYANNLQTIAILSSLNRVTFQDHKINIDFNQALTLKIPTEKISLYVAPTVELTLQNNDQILIFGISGRYRTWYTGARFKIQHLSIDRKKNSLQLKVGGVSGKALKLLPVGFFKKLYQKRLKHLVALDAPTPLDYSIRANKNITFVALKGQEKLCELVIKDHHILRHQVATSYRIDIISKGRRLFRGRVPEMAIVDYNDQQSIQIGKLVRKVTRLTVGNKVTIKLTIRRQLGTNHTTIRLKESLIITQW